MYASELPEKENGPEKLLGIKGCKLYEFGKSINMKIQEFKQTEIE